MNRKLCLARRPSGQVREKDLELRAFPLDPLGPGEALVRNTWLSIDPSVRIRLDATTPLGYLPPLQPGDPLPGLALGEVVDSRHPELAVGDLVSHIHGYRDFAVVGGDTGTIGGYGGLTHLDTGGLPEQWFLGPLGSTGLTAYAGLVAVLQLRDIDTIWVSAAAGGVGGVAAQLARLRGATVIGSAGSADKVDRLRREFGILAFDYRTDPPAEALAELAPAGIDAYFDNVGGDHLSAALRNMRTAGRIALCGAVSQYDGWSGAGPVDLFAMVSKQLRMQGFRAGSFLHLEPAMRAEIGGHITAGRLVHRETVFDGLERSATALRALLAGRTTGKTLCRLSHD
ncbi:MDR family NADP-dependent oxidoreductase [Nocardia spumae]|uniref:MDR family NADP-dependent oxidoreductase n=1 Tax=Nocardia spumae TaxID=2887190 RepID=UPI001D1485C1|nr:NADP-dependent oxidoreductase [Nocardia spumae]